MAVWQAGHCIRPKGWGRLCALLKSYNALSHPYKPSLTLLCPFLSHLLFFRRWCIPPSFHPSLKTRMRVAWTHPLFTGFIFPLMQTKNCERSSLWSLLCVSSCTKVQGAVFLNFNLAMQTTIKLWFFFILSIHVGMLVLLRCQWAWPW